MKRIFRVICFISFCISAQDKKFIIDPPTTEGEVKKLFSTIDKNAEAEILYSKVEYNIDKEFNVDKKVFTKIKIYRKNDAGNWLNVQIPVVGQQKISGFFGKISNFKNDRIVEVSVDKNQQLKEDLVKGVKVYKIAFPAVSDGSVLEYSYTLSNVPIMKITENLEFDIPVVYKVFMMEYPETLYYSFTHMEKTLQPTQKLDRSVEHIGGSHKVLKMAYENISSVKEENFVKNIDYYRAKLKPQVRSVKTNFSTYDSFENWSEAGKKLYNNERFGVFLKGGSDIILPVEIKAVADKKNRADKIFEFVKQNFKWNESNSIFTSQSYRQFVKSKAGNSADVNLLLINLFRNADLEANPILISTVQNGLLNYLNPDLGGLDKVLASVKIDNQFFLYDATSFASQPNILPEEDWNYNGVLLMPKESTDISFSNNSVSVCEEKVSCKIDIENSKIQGQFKKNSSAMFAITEFEKFDQNNAKYNETFKDMYTVQASAVDSGILKNGSFESSTQFSSESLLDIVGNKIIFNPLLFLNKLQENFSQTTPRQYDIDFCSPFKRSKIVEIEIPEGYKVGVMPKNKLIETDDKEVSYSYKFETDGNKLKINTLISVASGSYPREYYTVFKQIWKTISDTENQVVSLIKK